MMLFCVWLGVIMHGGRVIDKDERGLDSRGRTNVCISVNISSWSGCCGSMVPVVSDIKTQGFQVWGQDYFYIY